MSDLLLVVEAYLDQEAIHHHRDRLGDLCFNLPFGSSEYFCQISQDGEILRLDLMWMGQVEPWQVDQAEQALTRLSTCTTPQGHTLFNPGTGQVRYLTSVDFTLSPCTPDGMGIILETLIDPFNVKILAMQYVLEGRLTEDAAVACYDQWIEQYGMDAKRQSTDADDNDAFDPLNE